MEDQLNPQTIKDFINLLIGLAVTSGLLTLFFTWKSLGKNFKEYKIYDPLAFGSFLATFVLMIMVAALTIK